LDTHTYKTPGTYSVTVMIAVPMSHNPNDNVVTTNVTVTASTPTPTPTPSPTSTPAPPAQELEAAGFPFQVGGDRHFRGLVASFNEPNTRLRTFRASIRWGDGSSPSPGRIQGRGNGGYSVLGSHRFPQSGTFPVTVTILDAAGHTTTANGAAKVVTRGQKRG
jgi:hypothetical protein